MASVEEYKETELNKKTEWMRKKKEIYRLDIEAIIKCPKIVG